MQSKRKITIYLGVISILSVVINTAISPSYNKVQAQDLIPGTATTIVDPATTPEIPAGDTPTVPVGTLEVPPTDTVFPTDAGIMIPTETPSPTVTETPAPTATQEIPTGGFTWRVSVEVPIQPAEARSFGGVSGAKAHLKQTLQTDVTDTGVTINVDSTQVTASSATYKVLLEGNGGIDQFIQTIYSDLKGKLNLLNGPNQLSITGFVKTGQVIPIILESNITTGYIWELASYDPLMLEKHGNPVFEQETSGIGAPSSEQITLKAISEGVTTIVIHYRQPFNRGERKTRYIDLEGGQMPDVINLSNPYQVSANQVNAPITAEAAPALQSESLVTSYPATFDWKAQGKLTSVRNQGSCGSCWAFGTVGAMESAILIQSGQSVDLSEQFLISCNNNGWSCNGGWWAHDYHKNTLAKLQSVPGAVLESDMPYTASDGTCRTIANHPYKLTNWYSIAGNTIPTVDQIKNAITNYGPVAAAVCVGPAFSSYQSGIFSTNETSSCSSGVNHAIVLTGWDDATQSWVLRNSWGSGWGEAGYMRIKWGISNVGYAANYVVYSPSGTQTPTKTPTPVFSPTSTNTRTQTPTSTITPTRTLLPPVGYGTYDDRNSNISYSGTWVAQSVTGNYLNTEKYSKAIGSSARLTFTGENVSVIYRSYPNVFGNMEVQIDGAVAATINQNTPKATLQNRWASGNLGAGTHTLTLTHTNGTYVTVDAIIVSGPPTATPTATRTLTATGTKTPTPTPTALPPVSIGIYDERNLNVVYGGTWVAQSVSGNYMNTEKYSKVIGSSARMTFTGENVSILYRSYPNVFGTMEVQIDGTVVATINQNTPKVLLQNRWSSGSLGAGVHTITLTHLTGTYVTLDAIIVSGPPSATLALTNTSTPTKTLTSSPTPTSLPPVGYGTYDERNSNVAYTGTWVAQSVTGNYLKTEKYSKVIGSTAQLTFSGESVSVVYRSYPNVFGNMEVRIDGAVVATINQNTPVVTLQNRWSSGFLGAGTHTITLTHSSGTYVTLDAIIVSGLPTPTPISSIN